MHTLWSTTAAEWDENGVILSLNAGSTVGCGFVQGCTNPTACNYDLSAQIDDGSCFWVGDAEHINWCDCDGTQDFGCGCGEGSGCEAACDGYWGCDEVCYSSQEEAAVAGGAMNNCGECGPPNVPYSCDGGGFQYQDEDAIAIRSDEWCWEQCAYACGNTNINSSYNPDVHTHGCIQSKGYWNSFSGTCDCECKSPPNCDGGVWDCAGIANGSTIWDCAYKCDGDAELDCAGVCEGETEVDDCGVCEGDGSSCDGAIVLRNWHIHHGMHTIIPGSYAAGHGGGRQLGFNAHWNGGYYSNIDWGEGTEYAFYLNCPEGSCGEVAANGLPIWYPDDQLKSINMDALQHITDNFMNWRFPFSFEIMFQGDWVDKEAIAFIELGLFISRTITITDPETNDLIAENVCESLLGEWDGGEPISGTGDFIFMNMDKITTSNHVDTPFVIRIDGTSPCTSDNCPSDSHNFDDVIIESIGQGEFNPNIDLAQHGYVVDKNQLYPFLFKDVEANGTTYILTKDTMFDAVYKIYLEVVNVGCSSNNNAFTESVNDNGPQYNFNGDINPGPTEYTIHHDPFVGCDTVGDVNGDDSWNVLDIVTLATCVLTQSCDELPYACESDINNDGTWNVLDIVSLANCVLTQSCIES